MHFLVAVLPPFLFAASLQTYPGNMLLSPLNVVQWTGTSTAAETTAATATTRCIGSSSSSRLPCAAAATNPSYVCIYRHASAPVAACPYSFTGLTMPLHFLFDTGGTGEWYPSSFTMPSAPPDPKTFNVDAAANAVLTHINGTALLPAADLASGEMGGHRLHCIQGSRIRCNIYRQSAAAKAVLARITGCHLCTALLQVLLLLQTRCHCCYPCCIYLLPCSRQRGCYCSGSADEPACSIYCALGRRNIKPAGSCYEEPSTGLDLRFCAFLQPLEQASGTLLVVVILF
jgi:hypothetical protein